MMTNRRAKWKREKLGFGFWIAGVAILALAAGGPAPAWTAEKGPEKGESRCAGKVARGRGEACAEQGQVEMAAAAAGLATAADPGAGKPGKRTPEEVRRAAERLMELLSRSSEGLEVIRHPNGMLSIDLRGRFQSAVVATKNEEGEIALHCVSDPDAAKSLLKGQDRPRRDSLPVVAPAEKAGGRPEKNSDGAAGKE